MIDVTKLDPDLHEALKERGHYDEDIAHMSVEIAFDEWLGWQLGDPSWGSAIRAIQTNLKQAEVSK